MVPAERLHVPHLPARRVHLPPESGQLNQGIRKLPVRPDREFFVIASSGRSVFDQEFELVRLVRGVLVLGRDPGPAGAGADAHLEGGEGHIGAAFHNVFHYDNWAASNISVQSYYFPYGSS